MEHEMNDFLQSHESFVSKDEDYNILHNTFQPRNDECGIGVTSPGQILISFYT